MSNFAKTLFIIGAIFTLVGSFLPWRREGDFISYWTYGIRIFPTVKDNGGLLIVLLTLVVIMFVLRPPDFIEKTSIWNMLLSVSLVLASVFHVGKLFIRHANASGFVGAPTIQIGLVMVLIGSILLFLTALLYYRNETTQLFRI